MTGSKSNLNNQRVDSWKDIASYLGRDVRTAIRWEKDRGLPVRRIPGGQRKAVFAYTTELDAWLTQEGTVPQGTEQASRKPDDGKDGLGGDRYAPLPAPSANAGKTGLRHIALAALIFVCVVGGLTLFAWFGMHPRVSHSNIPVRVDFSQDAVSAFDENGLWLWSRSFPGKLEPSALSDIEPLSHFSYIGDFRGKGDHEVLVIAPYRTGPNPQDSLVAEVDLFSSHGELLWSYIPHARFEFGKHDLTGPWVVLSLFVSSHGGRKQIWAAATHEVWGNAFVVSLDPVTGKDTLRFVNTGAIHTLNEITTPRGTFLLAGGFNNEPDTGMLAIIDESKPFAVSPQSEGTRHKCISCPAGDPDYYFFFPRSEINELEQMHEDAVTTIQVTDDQIEIRKKENDSKIGYQTVYLLREDGGVRLVSVRFDSGYDMLHRQLEKEGKIGHSLEQCPERLHPRAVRMWTPVNGWTEIHLPPTPADQ
jgi:hypothetical protein